MHTLLRGLAQWASSESDPRPREGEADDARRRAALAAYRQCATRSGLWTPCREQSFGELLAELGDAKGARPAGTEVVRIDGGVVRFTPTRVGDDARRSQAGAFRALHAHWSRGGAIDELHVHLEDVTAAEVARVMRVASADDVRRGIAVWSTLPCRVGRVIVHEPAAAPLAWTVGRAALPRFLPRKVLRKTEFLKPHDAPAEQRQRDR